MKKNSLVVTMAILSFSLMSSIFARGPLTFEDRVKAHEALEKVYYAHRIWPKENKEPKPAFEKMVPRAVIEAKVTDYLKKCNALDKFWQRPIEPQQLQAEMDRMAKGTKDAKTLKELFSAIGDDPYLIAECLARPALADRLIHNWYSSDARFHGGLRAEAEELRASLTPANFKALGGEKCRPVHVELENDAIPGRQGEDGVIRLDPEAFSRVSSEFPAAGEISDVTENSEGFVIRLTVSKSERLILGGIITYRKADFEAWLDSIKGDLDGQIQGVAENFRAPEVNPLADPTSPDSWKSLWYSPEPRTDHTAVWTGTEMVIWGGSNGRSINTGGKYNPSTDTWTPTSTGTNCPSAREYHTAVWTGTEMVVWGGRDDSWSYLNTGGRYNPSTDTWAATSVGGNCPTARYYHTAVWTGIEMVIWGGDGGGGTGGRYNPSTDTWTATSVGGNCPTTWSLHTAVWTGTEMVVWGGKDDQGSYLNTGGRYNPSTDTWAATSVGDNCPTGRYSHTAVWTGTEMVVWGGTDYSWSDFNTGGRYNPLTDTWTDTSVGDNCPTGRYSHTTVWTGTEMVVWGGTDGSGSDLNTGGRYNPSTDIWTATSVGDNCPTGRYSHTAVWTGIEMVVWGGTRSSGSDLNTGGRYNTSTDTWTATSAGANCPAARYSHTAIWTGIEMVVWGGTDGSYSDLNTGGRYNPSTDAWTHTSAGANCPEARYSHTAIWTGIEMVVWGGTDGSYSDLNTGGRYNPSTDAWTHTSVAGNCPTGRYSHTAVWTGIEMVVWGGTRSSGSDLNTGGRYNPSTDTWTDTSTGADCPSARQDHTAVWTGTEMVVWGGTGGYSLKTGGRYNPLTDTWMTTSFGANCPLGRYGHTAVWTGTEMVIWGGYGGGGTGGRYNPSTDTWAATSVGVGCPTARYFHTAVWTGLEMVIWGGMGTSPSGLLNTGAKYSPSADIWMATPTGVNCPSARSYHTSVWTGDEMIIWDGNLRTGSGGIYYPNTPPKSIPSIHTSMGGDAIFVLGNNEMVTFDGNGSTDGSNPFTTTPFHDKLDGLIAYEWDLDGDANYGTLCGTSAGGADYTQASPPALSESDLALYGIASPGLYTIWLRVADKLGLRDCAPAVLTVCSAFYPTISGSAAACASPGAALNTELYNAYQWFNDGAPITGATSRTLLATQSGTYTVTGTDGNGCTGKSAGFSFTAWANPVPSISGPNPACQSATLNAGSYAAYQWYRNSSIISGATSQTYFAPVAGTYTVKVTDANGCQGTSAPFYVNANPTPAITGPSSGCPPVIISTTAFTTYQWTRGGVDIPGATSQTYEAFAGGDYRVRVTNSTGCAGSSAIKTVATGPSPEVTGANVNTCPYTMVSLGTGAFSTYQWRHNSLIIPGATSGTYLAGVSGNYTVTVTDGTGCEGTSVYFPVFVDFCPASEVSPVQAIFPAKIEPLNTFRSEGATPNAGPYYLYFQRIDSIEGYNVYEGTMGNYYSHSGSPGNLCNATVTDLGTGEMRAEVVTTEGNHYYLVTAFGAGSEGPSGYDSDGFEIPKGQSSCSP